MSISVGSFALGALGMLILMSFAAAIYEAGITEGKKRTKNKGVK